MAADRVIGPFVLANPVRRLIEPKGKVISRVRPFVQRGMRVLDLGSGPGYYTGELLDLVGPDGLVVAIDPSQSSIDRIKKLDRQNLKAIVGTAYSIPFEDGYFDFIFANLLLCCVADYRAALKEIMRVLRNGGIAYLSVTKQFFDAEPGIDDEKWKEVLGRFRVIKEDSSLTQRWAIVQKE
mgnify:CR=1 FL=1